MRPLIIKPFVLGDLKTNSYVITDKDTFCIVIDPGEKPEELMEFIGEQKIDYILLTHTHYDHIAGLNLLKKYTDASVVVHHSEAEWLLEPNFNGSYRFNDPIVCEWPDILLNGEELIKIKSNMIKVIHTPGHSPGSTCFLINNKYLFSGDTLLSGIVGPTDLPFSNREELKESIRQRLFVLDDQIELYPGHGEVSTIGFEKEYNLLPNLKSKI